MTQKQFVNMVGRDIQRLARVEAIKLVKSKNINLEEIYDEYDVSKFIPNILKKIINNYKEIE